MRERICDNCLSVACPAYNAGHIFPTQWLCKVAPFSEESDFLRKHSWSSHVGSVGITLGALMFKNSSLKCRVIPGDLTVTNHCWFVTQADWACSLFSFNFSSIYKIKWKIKNLLSLYFPFPISNLDIFSYIFPLVNTLRINLQWYIAVGVSEHSEHRHEKCLPGAYDKL